jgi:hypothetical protein
MPKYKVSQESLPMVIEAPDEYGAGSGYENALERSGTRGLLVEPTDEPAELTVDEEGDPIEEEE